MTTITIHINTPGRPAKVRTYTVPTTAAELKAKQLRIIAQEIARPGDAIEKKCIIFRRLARMPADMPLQGHHIIAAINLLSFLEDDAFRFDKPVIAGVGPWRTPRQRMSTFIADQMQHCDNILQAIQGMEVVPVKMQAQFCAANTTLYRLPWIEWIADWVAVPWFRYLVRERTRLALIIQYRAQRRIFPEQYENAFAQSETADRFPSLGWKGTFVRLAGDKFGKPRAVRRTKCHELFIFLEQCGRDVVKAKDGR